jgi:hypothetical protein
MVQLPAWPTIESELRVGFGLVADACRYMADRRFLEAVVSLDS